MYTMRYTYFVNYIFEFSSVIHVRVRLSVFVYLNLYLQTQIKITQRLHKDNVAIC